MMSGGHFDYKQFHIEEIAEGIQSILDRQGQPKPKDELWSTEEWYKDHPEDLKYETYSEETQKEFQTAVRYLKLGKIYAHRIDWFMSMDDGEETFHKRLKEELINSKLVRIQDIVEIEPSPWLNEAREREMHLNMQYYYEYCLKNPYVTPKDWIEKHKHF